MTAGSHIGRSIEAARQYLAEHPEEARYTDTAASAVIEGGLRCRVEGPDGAMSTPICPPASEVSRRALRPAGCSAPARQAVRQR